MSPVFHRTLPERPDPDQQRKLARDLLRNYRTNDPEAVGRIRAVLPDKPDIRLADAQFVLAREYGFGNWAEFITRIEAKRENEMPPVGQFRRAVESRDAVRLRRVLHESAEARDAIDQPLFAFDCPAIVAANTSVEVTKVLLEYGADPNRRSDWWAGGFHALHGASPDVAAALLAAGAEPDACAAAHLDRIDLLGAILADDPARVHVRGGDGKTPLHFARSRQAADLLLERGADIDATDVDHRSSPAEWMLDDRADLARYLVERGARVDIFLAAALGLTDRALAMIESDPTLLSLRTSQGSYAERPPSSYHIYQWTIGPNLTPLQVAAKFGQDDTLRALGQRASPAQQLLAACHRADAAAAHAIVAAHPGIVEGLAPDDARALTDEAWLPNPPAVRLMLDLGFDPSVPSISGPQGGNALHCASWEGSADAVRAILDVPRGRALVNVVEAHWNGTPLSWCFHGSRNCGNPRADHGAVARLLIAAGATLTEAMLDWEGSEDVNAAVREGLAPLSDRRG
jgi:ankyrin repeat protein